MHAKETKPGGLIQEAKGKSYAHFKPHEKFLNGKPQF